MDMDRVKLLLDVYHAVLELPNLKNIKDSAMLELREIDDAPEEVEEEPTPPAPAKRTVK